MLGWRNINSLLSIFEQKVDGYRRGCRVWHPDTFPGIGSFEIQINSSIKLDDPDPPDIGTLTLTSDLEPSDISDNDWIHKITMII